jgi:hypothetical protein
VSMSCHPEGCRPGLDPGSSGFRCLSATDAGGSPAATHFLCFAKESKQRKATPLRRPFGVPKISPQQRAARKLVARGYFFAKGRVRCSPLKQCERTAPVAGAKFWRSNMGNSRARISAVASCAAPHINTVILSVAEGSAFSSRTTLLIQSENLGPGLPNEGVPRGARQKTATLHPGKGRFRSAHHENPIIHGHLEPKTPEDPRQY